MTDTTLDTLTRKYSEERHVGSDDLAGLGASDRALMSAVARALAATGYPALRDIEVELSRGIVVLWGRVPSYHQKQLAQAVAQKVEGVRGIANGVEVVCGR